MKRPHGNRARLGGVLLAAALGALAMLALPTLGLGHGSGDPGPRPAGTIESFDPETGALVVDLTEGGTISALVVRRTQIRCGEGPHHLSGQPHRRRHGATASHRRAGEPGDRAGSAGDPSVRGLEPGDDNGGPGSELSDDPGARGVEPGDDNGDEPGEDADEHGRGHHGERCNTRDLVPGAVVIRAEIVLTHGNAFYKKIGLLPPQFAAAG